MLSLQTNDSKFRRAFDNLKNQYPSWNDLRQSDVSEIEEAIHFSGLASQKAQRIKDMLNYIYNERGDTSLSFLEQYNDKEAELYLLSLPGTGIKIAKCVLMYSLNRNVYPIDSNTLKIYKRLGIVDKTVLSKNEAIQLEAEVPEKMRYDLHVNLVAHAREICKTKKPRCSNCVISNYCSFMK